jgi:hypothetical protein
LIARVLRIQVAPESVEGVVHAYRQDVRPIHKQAAGLRQHLVLVSRESGNVEIIGGWPSAEDVARIALELRPARKRLWAQFGTDPPLEIYDVAAALR